MALKRTHILLDSEQKRALDEIARRQGRSVSELAREYIANGIDRSKLCERAFDWATRLNQLPVYDSFFLALAEKLDAEFWTADRRLVNGARQVGVEWVHWVGE